MRCDTAISVCGYEYTVYSGGLSLFMEQRISSFNAVLYRSVHSLVLLERRLAFIAVLHTFEYVKEFLFFDFCAQIRATQNKN